MELVLSTSPGYFEVLLVKPGRAGAREQSNKDLMKSSKTSCKYSISIGLDHGRQICLEQRKFVEKISPVFPSEENLNSTVHSLIKRLYT